jgi:hypothetical protein
MSSPALRFETVLIKSSDQACYLVHEIINEELRGDYSSTPTIEKIIFAAGAPSSRQLHVENI